jgi:hypothetical protein
MKLDHQIATNDIQKVCQLPGFEKTVSLQKYGRSLEKFTQKCYFYKHVLKKYQVFWYY